VVLDALEEPEETGLLACMPVMALVDMGCDPPQHPALFISGQKIDDLCELKYGVGRTEEFFAFVKQVGDKKGVPAVVSKRKTDKCIHVPAG
jgi:hypothetical protein